MGERSRDNVAFTHFTIGMHFVRFVMLRINITTGVFLRTNERGWEEIGSEINRYRSFDGDLNAVLSGGKTDRIVRSSCTCQIRRQFRHTLKNERIDEMGKREVVSSLLTALGRYFGLFCAQVDASPRTTQIVPRTKSIRTIVSQSRWPTVEICIGDWIDPFGII